MTNDQSDHDALCSAISSEAMRRFGSTMTQEQMKFAEWIIEEVSRHRSARVEMLEKALERIARADYDAMSTSARLGEAQRIARLALSQERKETEVLTSPSGDACWFVERRSTGQDQKRWLAGFDNTESAWTNDPQKAIRFCRERDANRMCVAWSVLLGSSEYKGSIFDGIGEGALHPQPTEHVFLDSHFPSPGEQVKELLELAKSHSQSLQLHTAGYLHKAAATIERLEAQLRYIDQRCEEQIQDRIRLGEALNLATRERDEARKVIERAANFIASEYAADNDAGVLIPDVEPRLIHESLCDFLAKQEGK